MKIIFVKLLNTDSFDLNLFKNLFTRHRIYSYTLYTVAFLGLLFFNEIDYEYGHFQKFFLEKLEKFTPKLSKYFDFILFYILKPIFYVLFSHLDYECAKNVFVVNFILDQNVNECYATLKVLKYIFMKLIYSYFENFVI